MNLRGDADVHVIAKKNKNISTISLIYDTNQWKDNKVPTQLPRNTELPLVLITAIKPSCAKEIVGYKVWIM